MIRRVALTLVLLVFVAAPSLVLADQVAKVKPDGVVKGFVSTTEQTRVHVEGDRIRRMLAPPAGFEAINDEKTGDVFLNPLPVEHRGKPAATFIITERGHTVQLRLTPKARPAQQVMIAIEDGGAPIPVARRAVRNAPFVDELVDFVGHVIRGEQPAGVEVRRGLRNPFGSGRTIEARWESGRFEAEVVRVIAESGPIALSEFQFIQTGVAAIWISDRTLSHGDVARVIVVKVKG